jgi:hypothetical protein
MELKNEVAKATQILNSRGAQIQTKLKDGTEINLWKFGRHDKEITLLMDDESDFGFPAYTNYSRSSFGFDIDTGILAKQCCKCKDWFFISKLSQEGKWTGIADNEVHFDNTRFRSDCNSCYEGRKSEKEAKVPKVPAQDISSKSYLPDKSKKAPRPETVKTSVNLTADERYYLRLLAALDNVKVEYVLARLIERERKERNLKL